MLAPVAFFSLTADGASGTKAGNDLALLRRLYVGRTVWAMGELELIDARKCGGFASFPSGTSFTVVSVSAVSVGVPVMLTLRYGESFGRRVTVRNTVADSDDAARRFSFLLPPRSVLEDGLVLDEPRKGMSPDEVAWIWGWPSWPFTKDRLRREPRWTWEDGRRWRSVVFRAGRATQVEQHWAGDPPPSI